MTYKKTCEHARYVDENLALKTSGCEECEKEGTEWVALRMCLSCGHVGYCDSSVGLHATKHFQKTSHPVMIALPDKSWKWCYADKYYVRQYMPLSLILATLLICYKGADSPLDYLDK